MVVAVEWYSICSRETNVNLTTFADDMRNFSPLLHFDSCITDSTLYSISPPG